MLKDILKETMTTSFSTLHNHFTTLYNLPANPMVQEMDFLENLKTLLLKKLLAHPKIHLLSQKYTTEP
jgi:hypothetical protein